MKIVSQRERAQALWMLILANSFWGLSFPLIKATALTHRALLPDSGTWFATAWTLGPRFILAAAALALWKARELGKFTRLEWQQGIGLGLFAGAGMLFQTDGLQFTAASTSAFLTQLYAILIPIYLAARRWRLPPWTVWISSAMVLAGVAILGNFDYHAMRFGRGEAETLIASLFFMGQILTLDNAAYAPNRVIPVTLLMMVIQGTIFTGIALATAPRASDLVATWHSAPWLAFTLGLALFSTLGAYLIMNKYQPKISTIEAGLIYCVEPLFGSIFALFLPAMMSSWAGIDYANEVATRNLVIGGGLITAANILIQLRPPPKE